jgi:hypothetical protein
MARRRALARVSGRSQQFPAGDALALAGALDEAAIVTLASAATVAIGAAQSNTIQISGTTTITSFDTVASGAVRRLVFSGALTLTHNATKLILPGAANVTTAAGDAATFVSLGGGNWRCVGYQLAASAGGGGGSAAFSKYYESPPQAITNDSLYTLAHGLGMRPKGVAVMAICISEVAGYVVGDTIEVANNIVPYIANSAGNSTGNNFLYDSSNLYVRVGQFRPFQFSGKNGGSIQVGFQTQWNLVFKAWA